MPTFQQVIQSWQIFYSTVAAAAATLTGLLFVSLSLNRDRLKGKAGRTTTDVARRTFGDFLYVIMLSLVFLVPHRLPLSLCVALLALGLSRAVGIVREIGRRRSARRNFEGGPELLREIGLPGIASLGIVIAALLIASAQYDILYVLVGVIAALLVSACWNAWTLLFLE